MTSNEVAIKVAFEHHQAGRLHEAELIYQRILEAEPENADVWFLIGLLAQQAGNNEEATEIFHRAIKIDSGKAIFHKSLGDSLSRMGLYPKAVASYELAIKLQPIFPDAYFELGNISKIEGRFLEAISFYQVAVTQNPNYFEAYNNLGNTLYGLGQISEATLCYQRAIEIHSNEPLIHLNLANALVDLGRRPAAIESFQQAIALKPDYVDALNNLGTTLLDLKRNDEAITTLQRAIEIDPYNAEGHNNLGIAYRANDRFDESLFCLKSAVRIKPNQATYLCNLAATLKDQGEISESTAVFKSILKLAPTDPATISNFLMTLNYDPQIDAASLLNVHRELLFQFDGLAEEQDQEWKTRINSAGRKLRIGYVSPDFRDHILGVLVAPLFPHHDHEQFEIYAYSNVRSPDEITHQIQSHVDCWRDISHLDDQQAAELIRQDQIDILVDLSMHMANNRLLVFARKPAPIQVCWLAYPGTTGLATMDYRLTDPYLDPPNLDEQFYSEKTIHLPDTYWIYQPPAESPAINELPFLRNGYITFGCLNNYCKVNEGVLSLWAKVLHQVPNSRMMILSPFGSHRDDALKVFAAEGVTANRIHFESRQPREKYLELYHHIDLGLDTFPYNGHTTSLDSFWMGVPVVTLVGNRLVGRAGVSQLTNLGLTELIAHTEEEYQRIAADLANDRRTLQNLRATLRQRMRVSPLLDAPRFARNIEAAYRTMWQSFVATPES